MHPILSKKVSESKFANEDKSVANNSSKTGKVSSMNSPSRVLPLVNRTKNSKTERNLKSRSRDKILEKIRNKKVKSNSTSPNNKLHLSLEKPKKDGKLSNFFKMMTGEPVNKKSKEKKDFLITKNAKFEKRSVSTSNNRVFSKHEKPLNTDFTPCNNKFGYKPIDPTSFANIFKMVAKKIEIDGTRNNKNLTNAIGKYLMYSKYKPTLEKDEDDCFSDYSEQNLTINKEFVDLVDKHCDRLEMGGAGIEDNKEALPQTDLKKSQFREMMGIGEYKKKGIKESQQYQKDKILRGIYIKEGGFKTYKASTKNKLFPAKIRILTDDPDLESEIYVSFTKDPLASYHTDGFLSYDLKSNDKFLQIEPHWEFVDLKKNVYITIVAKTTISGHIGIAFSGTKVSDTLKKDNMKTKYDSFASSKIFMKTLLSDLKNDPITDYVKDFKSNILRSEQSRDKKMNIISSLKNTQFVNLPRNSTNSPTRSPEINKKCENMILKFPVENNSIASVKNKSSSKNVVIPDNTELEAQKLLSKTQSAHNIKIQQSYLQIQTNSKKITLPTLDSNRTNTALQVNYGQALRREMLSAVKQQVEASLALENQSKSTKRIRRKTREMSRKDSKSVTKSRRDVKNYFELLTNIKNEDDIEDPLDYYIQFKTDKKKMDDNTKDKLVDFVRQQTFEKKHHFIAAQENNKDTWKNVKQTRLIFNKKNKRARSNTLKAYGDSPKKNFGILEKRMLKTNVMDFGDPNEKFNNDEKYFTFGNAGFPKEKASHKYSENSPERDSKKNKGISEALIKKNSQKPIKPYLRDHFVSNKSTQLEVNRKLAGFYSKYKQDSIDKNANNLELLTVMAQKKSREFLIDKISHFNQKNEEKDEKIKRRNAINEILISFLRVVKQRIWIYILKFYFSKENIENRYAVLQPITLIKRRKMELLVNLQNFMKKKALKLKIFQVRNASKQVTNSLRLYLSLISQKSKKKVIQIAGKTLAWMFHCQKMRNSCFYYIIEQVAFKKRFVSHSNNIKTNFKKFQKQWNKELFNIIDFKTEIKHRKIYAFMDTEAILVHINTEKFLKQIYELVYNFELILNLQTRFIAKEKTRKIAEAQLLLEKERNNPTESQSNISDSTKPEETDKNQNVEEISIIEKIFGKFQQVIFYKNISKSFSYKIHSNHTAQ